MAVSVLKDSYKGVADIKVEGNIIQIIPTKISFTYEVMQAMDGDRDELKMWRSIEESLKASSRNISKEVMLTIINPMNKDNMFLIVRDGVTIYNCV
jgi:hypothetical protein